MKNQNSNLHLNLKELQLLETEWKETRNSIDRFDRISIDLRKYGLSLITFLITSSSIALAFAKLSSALPALIAPSSIIILICALFVADRYNEALLLSTVLRSRQLEDISQEAFDHHLHCSVYLRFNLTTFLEDSVQKTIARKYSFFIYVSLVLACIFLGLFSLLALHVKTNEPTLLIGSYISMLVIFGSLSTLFLVKIDRKITRLIAEIESTVIIDNRLIIKKIFRKRQIDQAIKELAKNVNESYNRKDFKIMTIGIGGLQIAQQLIAELKKLKRTNVELISVFSEKKDKNRIEIEPPRLSLIKNQYILIVDDLVASGRTISKLKQICLDSRAKDVKTCILMDAPNQREGCTVKIDYLGLTTLEEGRFVGCGLDYESKYRELPFIGIVKPILLEKVKQDASRA